MDEDLRDLLCVTTAYVLQRCAKRIRDSMDDNDANDGNEESTKKKRQCWVRPWLVRRHQLGAYDGLMLELANEDLEGYVSFQRMAPQLFAELLSKVGPSIVKQDTVMRSSISPGARLAITLRFLATGKYFICKQKNVIKFFFS